MNIKKMQILTVLLLFGLAYARLDAMNNDNIVEIENGSDSENYSESSSDKADQAKIDLAADKNLQKIMNDWIDDFYWIGEFYGKEENGSDSEEGEIHRNTEKKRKLDVNKRYNSLVKSYLEDKNNKNAITQRTYDWLLSKAVDFEDLELTQYLLKKSANPNFNDLTSDLDSDRREMSIFMYAVFRGNNNIIKALIENGATINQQDNDGDTPLAYAVRNGLVEIVEALIKKHANVNAINHGQSVLLLAILQKNAPIIKLLLDAGATTNNLNNRQKLVMKKLLATQKEIL